MTDLFSDENVFKEVKFGHGEGYQIVNPVMYDFIRDKLMSYRLNTKGIQSSYKIYEENDSADDFKRLTSDHHLVTYNFRHKPFLLYLTTYCRTNLCVYYNTHNACMTVVKHGFSDMLFESETVFQGNIVEGDERLNGEYTAYYYMIDELVVVKGTKGYVKYNSIIDRVKWLNEMVCDSYMPDIVMDPIFLRIKDFTEYSQLRSFVEDYIPNLPFRMSITGLVFIPIHQGLRTIMKIERRQKSNESSNYKVKSVGQIMKSKCEKKKSEEIDVIDKTIRNLRIRVTNSPDIYETYDGDNKLGLAFIRGIKDSVKMRKIFRKSNTKDLVFKCEYCKKFKKWIPMKVVTE